MACPSEALILARVRGDLAPAERAAIDGHVDTCDACRQLLAAVAEDASLEGEVSAPTRGSAGVSTIGIGSLIGRYRIQRTLGEGAMGTVYAAEHTELRRRVALKVAKAPPGAPGDHLRARLRREARAASAIRHPHVVTVHDVLVTADGTPAIVMDLLEGETLRARLRRVGRLPVEASLRFLDQILGALEAAHGQGVVHRDLKPDNIFIVDAPDGEAVRVVDFGIAKLTATHGPAAASTALTSQGVMVGTPHYMSPEQAFGDPVDARSDLWSVGAIAFECLSGRRPLEGDSTGEILRRLARHELLRLDDVAPALPPSLRRWVHELLVERERRPMSAYQTRQALATLDREPRPGGFDDTLVEPCPIPEATADTLDAHEAAPPVAPSRRPWGWLAAATVVTAAGAWWVPAAGSVLDRDIEAAAARAIAAVEPMDPPPIDSPPPPPSTTTASLKPVGPLRATPRPSSSPRTSPSPVPRTAPPRPTPATSAAPPLSPLIVEPPF